MNCPRCGAAMTPGDRFCEECGARVSAPAVPNSGGRAETVGAGLAGRTDQGLRHPENQDAFAVSGPMEGGAGTILVVCDGVSNSQTPQAAARMAATIAHDVLQAGGGTVAAMEDAMADAIRRAHDAVCALPFDRQAEIDPPATTIVAAVVHEGGITLGWLGDSRAYWLDSAGARQLTRDHSWLAMVVDRHEMTEAEALRDPRAHALLYCLGTTDFAVASPCPAPGIATIGLGEGWLVLCSDGVWNYAETAVAMLLAAGEGVRGDAADLCARLVDYALSCGGRDNITVAAVRVVAR